MPAGGADVGRSVFSAVVLSLILASGAAVLLHRLFVRLQAGSASRESRAELAFAQAAEGATLSEVEERVKRLVDAEIAAQRKPAS